MIVSIITPSYNIQNFIESTYVGIKAQTLSNWEWIVVDDASTDETVSIITSFNDPRIKIIRSEHTGNLAILRNRGAAVARGDYFAFVDGDDVCEPTKFESQVKNFERHPEIAWNHTAVMVLKDETGELVSRKEPPDRTEVPAEEAFAMIAHRNPVCVSSVMVRRDVFFSVGGFDEKFHRCEDIHLWLKLTASGYAMGYISNPLLRYRVRASGLYVSKRLEYLAMDFDVYYDLEKKFPELFKRFSKSVDAHFSDIHLKMAIQMLYAGQHGYNKHFKIAVRKSPSPKKILWYFLSFISPRILQRYLKDRLS